MTAGVANEAPRRPIASRWAIAAAVSSASAMVLLEEALATLARPTSAVVWGSLALTAWAVGLLSLIGACGGEGLGFARWRFGPWILLWNALTFGLATITFGQPQTVTGTAAQVATSSVLRALWLVSVGMSIWMVGYFVGPGAAARRSASRAIKVISERFTAKVRSPMAPWILYAIGSVARLTSALTTGRFGYIGEVSSAFSIASGYGQVLTLIGTCAPLAVAAAAIQVFRERLPGAWITLSILASLELAVSAASGHKANFLFAALTVIVPYSAARRRLPTVLIALVLVVFMVIIIPFTLGYRSDARGGPTTLSSTEAVSAAPGILSQTLTSSDMALAIPSSLDYLLIRMREIDTPAIILQRSPAQVGFLSAGQLIEAPLVDIVPRAIWPGKPIVTAGYQVNQNYYDQPATNYSVASVTPIGDLYRHGGWIPVIVGMFVLGCGVRLLDDVLDVRSNPHAIFLVLLLFPALVGGEKDWVSLLAGIPGIMLIWLLAVSLTFRSRKAA